MTRRDTMTHGPRALLMGGPRAEVARQALAVRAEREGVEPETLVRRLWVDDSGALWDDMDRSLLDAAPWWAGMQRELREAV